MRVRRLISLALDPLFRDHAHLPLADLLHERSMMWRGAGGPTIAAITDPEGNRLVLVQQ
ncbi:MAG: hypothetical protein IVW36_02110 [Dehalococcoidia bacterium]|nr:hypothetical protein [Dehalococcoidia bacterium]